VLYLSSSPFPASSRCLLLPAPAGHPYNAVAGSFWIRGAAPSPLIARVVRKRSAARGRPDASTVDKKVKNGVLNGLKLGWFLLLYFSLSRPPLVEEILYSYKAKSR
jgi:hypothetical protein